MDSLEQQLHDVDWKNPESIVRFYESNQLYFDNYQLVHDEDKISAFIDIKLHYVNSLFSKAHYDKVMPVLDQVQALLGKLPSNHWNHLKSDRYSRFMKGRLLGDQKNFRESYAIFKQLVKEDPEHYYYRVWYNHTRLGLYNWFFNALSAVGLTLIVLDLVFSLHKVWGVGVGVVGVIIATLSYVVHAGLREYFKRNKRGDDANNSGQRSES